MDTSIRTGHHTNLDFFLFDQGEAEKQLVVSQQNSVEPFFSTDPGNESIVLKLMDGNAKQLQKVRESYHKFQEKAIGVIQAKTEENEIVTRELALVKAGANERKISQQEVIKSLQESNDTQNADIEKLRKELIAAQAENARMQAALYGALSAKGSLISQIGELHKVKKAEVSSFQKHVQVLERTLGEKQENLDVVQVELSKTRMDLSEKQVMIKAIEEKERQSSTLRQREIDTLRQLVRLLDDESERKDRRIAELEQDVVNKQNAHNGTTAELNKVNATLVRVKGDLVNVQKILEETTGTLNRRTLALQHIRNQCNAMIKRTPRRVILPRTPLYSVCVNNLNSAGL